MPDVTTLQLCSVLTSAAFAGVFIVLWRGRRSEPWLVLWATSSTLYAATLSGFQLFPLQSPVPASLFVVALALTHSLILAGVRVFDGHRPFTPGMVAMIAGGGIVTALFAVEAPALINIVTAAVLTVSMIFFGLPLVLSRPDDGTQTARRIAGAAMLAYVPGFLVSILLEVRLGPVVNWLAMVPTLSDQLLLALLNLSLLAIPGQRSQHALRRAALHDPLTGAWNRAALSRHEAALARPGHAVILIDVDHFKQINDRHGHAAGDAVLIRVASGLLRHAAAHKGRVVRLGGDEFLLVVPAADADEARALADQVRTDATRPVADLPAWSVSIGVATTLAGDTGLSEAMARADRLLYCAKNAGRDRIAA